MITFATKELVRLIDKLQETDPATPAYHILLQSIEILDSIGNTVDEIDNRRSDHELKVMIRPDVIAEEIADKINAIVALPSVPHEATDFPADPPEKKPEEKPAEQAKTYTGAEVRRAMVAAKQNGVDVKPILAEFGADNFNGVPAAKYPELMARLVC